MNPVENDRLLTAQEVAELLQVHPNYVWEKAASGHIPSVKIGRHRRFSRVALDRWLEQLGSAA